MFSRSALQKRLDVSIAVVMVPGVSHWRWGIGCRRNISCVVKSWNEDVERAGSQSFLYFNLLGMSLDILLQVNRGQRLHRSYKS